MRTSDPDFFRYFPTSGRDRRWGLYVTGVGATLVPPFYTKYPLSRHPDAYMYVWDRGRVLGEYQALYIYQGDGEFESASAGKLKVEPESLILLFPGDWHRYRPRRESGWEEYWVSFSGPFMDELVEQAFFSAKSPVLHIGPDETVLHAFEELRHWAREQPIGFQQVEAAQVHLILAASLAAVRRRKHPEGADFIRRAKASLEKRVEGGLKISAIARSLHLSEKHFRRLFKEHTGMSPYKYYLELKMHRARQMLNTTRLPIKQIAAILGFDSPFYFSAIFKQRTGVSPSQWRRRSPEGD
jgi:AraC-like DNA-binding protein